MTESLEAVSGGGKTTLTYGSARGKSNGGKQWGVGMSERRDWAKKSRNFIPGLVPV